MKEGVGLLELDADGPGSLNQRQEANLFLESGLIYRCLMPEYAFATLLNDDFALQCRVFPAFHFPLSYVFLLESLSPLLCDSNSSFKIHFALNYGESEQACRHR